MRLTYSILLPFIFFLFTLSAYAQPAANIRGRLLTAEKQPIAGATITVSGKNWRAATDEQGMFQFSNITYGNYTLSFQHQGYEKASVQITVQHPQENIGDLLMQPTHIALLDVTITTQSRPQSSVEVPISVSTVSGDLLNKLNIRQMDEMAEFVPGLQVQLQSPNNPGYVIRGITSDHGDARSQPRISVFQDGISISRSRASAVELFDIERVEVAKGPQGTLFGRGAEIGAIHIIQNKPQRTFGAAVNAGYGAYNNRFVNGYINTPISEQLANRLAINYEARDGFIANRAGGRLNGKETFAIRNSTRLWGNEKTVVDLILNYQYDNYPGTSFKSKLFAPAGGDINPNSFADLEQGEGLHIKRHVGGATLLVDHAWNDAWKLSSLSGFRAFHADESFDADGTAAQLLWLSEIAKGQQFSQEFRLNYDAGRRLSGFVGASYFYENSSQAVPMRIDQRALYPAYIAPLLGSQLGAQIGALGQNLGLPAEQISGLNQQIQQLFTTAPIMTNGQVQLTENLPNLQPLALGLVNQLLGGTLPAGVTWDQLVQSGMLPAGVLPTELITLVSLLNGSPIAGMHEESSTNYGRNQAIELFGDGSFDLTEQLKVTVGLRGSYEAQRGGYMAAAANPPSIFGMIANNGSPNLLNPVSDGTIYAQRDYFSYVGRLALNYLFDKNNVFASISRGRRPGVINILPAATNYLNPEIVWSYELGLKGLLNQGRLSYELSTYYYDWSNFQTLSIQQVAGSIAPQLLADDGGKAHSFGIEAGLRYFILPAMQLFGNYAYIDGKFNQTDGDGHAQHYAGNRFRLTPMHSYALGLDANIPTSTASSVYIRPSYAYRSGVFFEDDNRADLYQKGYGLANFTAGYRFGHRRVQYEIGAYGKNIFDTQYIIDAGNSGDTIGFPTYVGGTRSVIGAQLNVRF
ncbi:TonB-dependent receptor [Sphingobacterium oryzagri]|uniref:TonB-dependent receptor n=1 Tax=Sphingobacterium oryzagri TaxID=3025669 RepID=A0ABY7WHA0_9SPHI|nr:TonB-dependent receptor [Sphingobacterium sp. KACC 22765]WDF69007.1 TonB-dependent receptor [Sphingobacterium sp. KACC 22765]